MMSQSTTPNKQPETIEEFNARYGAKHVTWKQLIKVIDHDTTATVDVIKRILAGPRVDGRFAALEARLAALEVRPELKYCGAWRSDTSYSEGSLTTKSGGMWYAEACTDKMPGTVNSGWRLVVKSGGAE
jgi:hypothetical protein